MTVRAPAIQALIIWPNDTYEVCQLDDKPSTYRSIIGDTDGTFEAANITIWCSNKPGPFNPMASYLWWLLEPEYAERERLDGTVIITGQPDEAGYPTPLPDNILETYRNLEASQLPLRFPTSDEDD